MIPEKPKGLQATPDQWKAIATRGNNLLVSASAGSGKTKVLVERILMHIQEGIDINELLVVTFTELAAKEMKERLRTKLEEAIEKLDMVAEGVRTTKVCYFLSKQFDVYMPITENIYKVLYEGLSIKDCANNLMNKMAAEELNKFE